MMIDNRKDMSCQEFSARMAELIGAGEDIFAHPHVRRCKIHRALLDDLEIIAKAARQLFPEVDPPATLWDEIQSRLGFQQPEPIVSDPWPGCRVVLAMQMIEHYNPQASPPVPDQPTSRMKVLGAVRTPARRGRRR